MAMVQRNFGHFYDAPKFPKYDFISKWFRMFQERGYCQTSSQRTYESAGGSTLHSDNKESQEDSEAFVLEVSGVCTRCSQSAWLYLQACP